MLGRCRLGAAAGPLTRCRVPATEASTGEVTAALSGWPHAADGTTPFTVGRLINHGRFVQRGLAAMDPCPPPPGDCHTEREGSPGWRREKPVRGSASERFKGRRGAGVGGGPHPRNPRGSGSAACRASAPRPLHQPGSLRSGSAGPWGFSHWGLAGARSCCTRKCVLPAGNGAASTGPAAEAWAGGTRPGPSFPTLVSPACCSLVQTADAPSKNRPEGRTQHKHRDSSLRTGPRGPVPRTPNQKRFLLLRAGVSF